MTCLLLYNLHDCTFKYLRQILVIVIIHLQNSKLNKDFRPVMRRLKNMRMFDIIYLRLKRIYFFHKRLYCQFFFLLIFTFKKNNIAPLHNIRYKFNKLWPNQLHKFHGNQLQPSVAQSKVKGWIKQYHSMNVWSMRVVNIWHSVSMWVSELWEAYKHCLIKQSNDAEYSE